MNKLAAFLSLLVAAAAAFFAYAAANYSHAPDMAIPIAGVALANIVLAIAVINNRRWAVWVLWAGTLLQLFLIYYMLNEAFVLGRLNGLDYVVVINLVNSAVLLMKVLIEANVARRISFGT